MTTPPHGITPRCDGTVFSSTTHQVLDWLAEQGLHPVHGEHWGFPPAMTVEFGAGSGWLWGNLTISCNTGRLKHLKACWIDADGTQRLDVADGPAAIRAELECHGTHRVERIIQLARRHGLAVTAPELTCDLQATVPG